MQQTQPRKIDKDEVFKFEFSICTLVTNMPEYLEMRESFIKGGFTTDTCEYLYIDNITQNTFEAYAGLNRFLREAKGKYIILCHQDILLTQHGLNDLRDRIDEIGKIDPQWGILGNAGSVNIKYRAVHLIQGLGKKSLEKSAGNSFKDLVEKYLPIRVATLDENFIIVKNSANVALSADLGGFHFYGADICLVADVLGFSCYVIDFKLLHKSEGNDDSKFYQLKRKLIRKYGRAFRSRFTGTTVTRFYISGNKLLNILGNTRLILFIARQYYKIFRRKSSYHRQV